MKFLPFSKLFVVSAWLFSLMGCHRKMLDLDNVNVINPMIGTSSDGRAVLLFGIVQIELVTYPFANGNAMINHYDFSRTTVTAFLSWATNSIGNGVWKFRAYMELIKSKCLF
jgi:hypothetical protein